MLEKTFEFAESLTVVGITQRVVVDATAGAGPDSLSLAEWWEKVERDFAFDAQAAALDAT